MITESQCVHNNTAKTKPMQTLSPVQLPSKLQLSKMITAGKGIIDTIKNEQVVFPMSSYCLREIQRQNTAIWIIEHNTTASM